MPLKAGHWRRSAVYGGAASFSLNLIFLDEPDLPLSQSLAVGLTTAWDQLDGASRLVALEILTRLIARMLSAQSTKEANDE